MEVWCGDDERGSQFHSLFNNDDGAKCATAVTVICHWATEISRYLPAPHLNVRRSQWAAQKKKKKIWLSGGRRDDC